MKKLLLTLAGVLAPAAAVAQSSEPAPPATIDVQNFWPTAGPAQSPTLRSTDLQPHLALGFALISNYAYRTLVFQDRAMPQTTFESVQHTFTTDFLWAFGLFNRAQISVALPLAAAQSGVGLTPILGGDNGLPATAIRDVRFELSVAIVRRERRTRAEGFGLRADLGGALPIGRVGTSNSATLNGAPTFTFAPMVVADYTVSGLTFTANLGARVRGVGAVANIAWASQLVVGAGIAYRPPPADRLSIGVDYFVLAPLYSGFATTGAGAGGRVELRAPVPMELYIGGRYALDRARDIELVVGAGIPISREPTVPAFRAIAGLSYAPRGLDNDRDGVLEADDLCPNALEDRDGFQDGDGCVDPDNDGDRILDAADRCPSAPEDFDNFEDNDGCPESDNDRDGVPDGEDRCATEPSGAHPDATMRGCPVRDRDGDGVLDGNDQCIDEAQGERPDPARPGCAIPDRDRDGVSDADDQCPGDPAGAHADRFRAGCPDADRDHDGVANEIDRCPDTAETINGVDDTDGCTDAGDEATNWAGDVVVFSNVIRLRARARALPPAATPALAQAAQRIRGRGAEVERVRVEVVPASARPADIADAERLATLTADALVTAGVPRAQVVTGAVAAPAAAPAGTPTPRRPIVQPAGEVRIRIERRTTPAMPAASATPASSAPPSATPAP